MSRLVRARDLRGLPVVTLDTAEAVAEVKDVVFSHADAMLVGFTLNKRGRLSGPMREVLPRSRISAIGRDAVMVPDRSALGGSDEAMAAAAGGEMQVTGVEVFTDAGEALGEVADLVVDLGEEAQVVGFEISPERGTPRLMPIADTIAVSGQALVVPQAAKEYVADDLAGFTSAVTEYRARLRGGERPAPPAPADGQSGVPEERGAESAEERDDPLY